MLSPTTTNEAVFTYNHLTQVVDITGDTPQANYDAKALGFTFQEPYRVRICATGIRDLTADRELRVRRFERLAERGEQFSFTDNFTKVMGKHTLKTGFFWNRNDNGQQPVVDGIAEL